jgi:glutamyl-tRNA synthetase
MLNFLGLLGWSPGTDQELFTRDELTSAFKLEGIGGGNAPVFNTEKLEWFSQQHLLRLPPDELARRLRPSFEVAGLWDEAYLGDRHAWFFMVLELLKPRAKRLPDFALQGRFFFVDAVEYDEAAVEKHLLGDGGMADHLRSLSSAFGELPSFDAQATEAALRGIADGRGVKPAALIHAVRVAVTGKAASPGLFEVLALVGREKVRARLAEACRRISLAPR